MLVLAHRGASRDAPENTPDAFRLADRQGADGVELDVRLHPSGRLLVRHDPLPAVDVTDAPPPPTLDDALDACGDRMLVNVEIKNLASDGGFDPTMSIAARTVEVLRAPWRAMVRSVADLVVLVGHDPGLPPHRAGDPDGVAAHHGRRAGDRPGRRRRARRDQSVGAGARRGDGRALSRRRAAGERVDVQRPRSPRRVGRVRRRRRLHGCARGRPRRAQSSAGGAGRVTVERGESGTRAAPRRARG